MKQSIPIKDEYLLQRALTHRSYLNEHSEVIEDNERLEFLGDAVLDFFVADWVYHHFPEMAEGDLTKLRSALVKTEQLAEFARQLGLGEMMLLGKGEAESGGRNRANLLCATFEAVIGAIYLDGGIEEVQKFLKPIVEKTAEEIIAQNKKGNQRVFYKSGRNRMDMARLLIERSRCVVPNMPRHLKLRFTLAPSVMGEGKVRTNG